MAQRSNNKRGLRGFWVLLVVVLAGGFALHATGNLVQPFQYSSIMLNAPSPEMDSGFEMIEIGGETDGATNTGFEMIQIEGETGESDEMERRPPEGGVAFEDQTIMQRYFDFSWEDSGEVLYNLWFMLLMTLGVVVLTRPVGWMVKQIKSLNGTSRTTA